MSAPEKVIYKLVELEDGTFSYDCQLCGKSFLESAEVEQHVQEHYEDQTWRR